MSGPFFHLKKSRINRLIILPCVLLSLITTNASADLWAACQVARDESNWHGGSSCGCAWNQPTENQALQEAIHACGQADHCKGPYLKMAASGDNASVAGVTGNGALDLPLGIGIGNSQDDAITNAYSNLNSGHSFDPPYKKGDNSSDYCVTQNTADGTPQTFHKDFDE